MVVQEVAYAGTRTLPAFKVEAMASPRRRRQQQQQDDEPIGGACASARRNRDLRHLALWAAATLAGVVSVVLASRAPFFRRMQRKLGLSGTGGGRRPGRERSLPMLAEAIVGNTRGAVASVFGPPRTAVLSGPVSGIAEAAAWEAETWYYALERDQPLAMAIEFDRDGARHVEFFQAPMPPVSA